MKNVKNMRNIVLAAVLLVAMAVIMVVKTFYPTVIFPRLNIPNMVLLSLAAWLLANRLGLQGENCWICTAVLSALSFALLPAAAGLVEWGVCWKVGVIGGAVFTLTALAMDSVQERIASGPKAPGALLATALGVYMASQCFAGILL